MKTSREARTKPNILVTGVPGTGKSTLAPKIAEKCSLKFMDINKMILDYKLHSGYDNEYKSFILDEDKLLDHLEEYFDDLNSDGGLVIDYHACDFFPERWFDYVIVLRCDNTQLYDRLKTRNYSEKKLRDNIECEIFGTIAEEAEDAYKEGIVHQLQNSLPGDLEKNLEMVAELVTKFKP
ncbi:unnamed protein product [Bursaphelenchus xylophilus]|uniref:Adenylate kinase isoenzyme 6 homolog n=1 Tax=Bursaphelenchus xylophilus TaxID=6326 RepID=A0A1I7S3X6_BURXY|nr:unnamed protein product [Bursaphelenchus xylophilus]CAG9116547.1 unnamed protein product [Bursaphelenchus xylophilus]